MLDTIGIKDVCVFGLVIRFIASKVCKICSNKLLFCFRHRIAEISFVLKAIATLLSSLKKAPIEKGKFISIF